MRLLDITEFYSPFGGGVRSYLAAKTRWEADDVIINSLRNMGLLWFFLAGAWGAVNATEFPARWEDLLRKSLQVLVALVVLFLVLLIVLPAIGLGLAGTSP